MGKNDFLKQVARESGATIEMTKVVLDGMEKVVLENFTKEPVKIMNGLTLMTVYKEERVGRNPLTGEQVMIPARIGPKCKFGKAIKDACANATNVEEVNAEEENVEE